MLGLGLGLTSPAVLGGVVAAAYVPVDATAVVDIDFARQRYWWGGALKSTANFTTFNLNGSTLDATGLTPSATVDITLSLATVGGTFVPGAHAIAATNNSAPGTNRAFFQIDNGGNTERVYLLQGSTALWTTSVTAASAGTAAVGGAGSSALSVKQGHAGSYVLDNVLASFNGIAGTADVSAAMPTGLTTLRVGKNTAANSQATGVIARILIFATTKTQAELNTLSVAMRDSS